MVLSGSLSRPRPRRHLCLHDLKWLCILGLPVLLSTFALWRTIAVLRLASDGFRAAKGASAYQDFQQSKKWVSEWVLLKFNGTSTPKGSYRAKTGDNYCNVNSSRYRLRTATCESICYPAKSEQNVRQDLIPRVRHGEAALMKIIVFTYEIISSVV